MMHRIFFAFIWIIGRVLLWIYRVDVKGLENLPKHSVLLCPNHSTDLDPVLIGLCLPLDYHLHFMAKAELFDNRALAWLIRTLGAFPVQRDGKDIQLRPLNITKVGHQGRKDTNPEKRVELHLHTRMSNMDALTDTESVIKQAIEWGHPAIAITDTAWRRPSPTRGTPPRGRSKFSTASRGTSLTIWTTAWLFTAGRISPLTTRSSASISRLPD